ncbi:MULTISPECIES: MFS transporter [Leptolyngbya]|nr:MFS transporter [Leptolyngbya boryana]ULP29447.1 AmpG family muropeptide MFS transporter [Leptolyngbya boryana IU 594]
MNIQPYLKVFRSRKMAALSLLGFSSGLPFLLTGTGRALQAWLKTAGVSDTMIGLFGLAALPYSLKVFWAPFLDRSIPPLFGRRRGWLILTQIALVAAILLLSRQDPMSLTQLGVASTEVCASSAVKGLCEFGQSFKTLIPSAFFQIALLVAFLSATQDISADAYRTDVLNPAQMGSGAAFFVTGYRIALVIAGGIALMIADPKNPGHWAWSQVYLLMAGLMAIGIIATVFAPEPKNYAPPTTMQAAIIQPFQDFIRRLGWGRLLAVLAFVVLYRYGDALLSVMVVPFLLGAKYSQSDIGAIQGFLGILATIGGTIVGGGIFSKIGVNKSLWIFGILQALSNVAYWLLAMLGKSGIMVWIPMLIFDQSMSIGWYQTDLGLLATIFIENFCTGLGTAGFLGFMMTVCNPQFSATQFALLSSLMAVSRDIMASPAGAFSKSMGWSNFFLATILAAIPGLLLLPFFAPWNEKNPE